MSGVGSHGWVLTIKVSESNPDLDYIWVGLYRLGAAVKVQTFNCVPWRFFSVSFHPKLVSREQVFYSKGSRVSVGKFLSLVTKMLEILETNASVFSRLALSFLEMSLNKVWIRSESVSLSLQSEGFHRAKWFLFGACLRESNIHIPQSKPPNSRSGKKLGPKLLSNGEWRRYGRLRYHNL